MDWEFFKIVLIQREYIPDLWLIQLAEKVAKQILNTDHPISYQINTFKKLVVRQQHKHQPQ